ncbi:MAG: hypothetical protein ACFCD0_09060 [Gemmataceae bacterium]
MTRDQFVARVKEAFQKTGLIPMQGDFYCECGAASAEACALGAIVMAHKGVAPGNFETGWMDEAGEILGVSYEFCEGVTFGFDGEWTNDNRSEDFKLGVECGAAAYEAVSEVTEEGRYADQLTAESKQTAEASETKEVPPATAKASQEPESVFLAS